MNRPARDRWFRAAQSIPLNIAEGIGKQSLKYENRFFEIARRSAIECASIHDLLVVCDAIDVESNRRGKSDLQSTVSMLTRLIRQNESVSEGSIEYECKCRDVEYEYEKMPEQSVGSGKP
jgi:four helix bundle protein